LALAVEALKDLVRRVLGEVEGVSRDLDFDREGMREHERAGAGNQAVDVAIAVTEESPKK
jgi:hypothetical protein